jgi:hypothetical protein
MTFDHEHRWQTFAGAGFSWCRICGLVAPPSGLAGHHLTLVPLGDDEALTELLEAMAT